MGGGRGVESGQRRGTSMARTVTGSCRRMGCKPLQDKRPEYTQNMGSNTNPPPLRASAPPMAPVVIEVVRCGAARARVRKARRKARRGRRDAGRAIAPPQESSRPPGTRIFSRLAAIFSCMAIESISTPSTPLRNLAGSRFALSNKNYTLHTPWRLAVYSDCRVTRQI